MRVGEIQVDGSLRQPLVPENLLQRRAMSPSTARSTFEPRTYRVAAENDGWIGEARFTVTKGGTAAR